MPNPTITQVKAERWEKAQEFELRNAQNIVDRGDDYNFWWRRQFRNYRVLKNSHLPNVLEVGCGPHTNLRLILPMIKALRIVVEDPLIHSYLTLRSTQRVFKLFTRSIPTGVARLRDQYPIELHAESLEDLTLPDESMDLCVCINVLDHVRDSDACLHQMERVLKTGGLLVIGQDLSNQQDLERCPESWQDVGHPIKIDHTYLDEHLYNFSPLFYQILPREKGRNPRCHYGTYLLIGSKKHAA